MQNQTINPVLTIIAYQEENGKIYQIMQNNVNCDVISAKSCFLRSTYFDNDIEGGFIFREHNHDWFFSQIFTIHCLENWLLP